MASVLSGNDRFAIPFSEGGALRSKPFSNGEFRVAAQSRFGVPLTCLKPSTNKPPKSSASAPGKFVGAFGNNIKSLWGRFPVEEAAATEVCYRGKRDSQRLYSPIGQNRQVQVQQAEAHAQEEVLRSIFFSMDISAAKFSPLTTASGEKPL